MEVSAAIAKIEEILVDKAATAAIKTESAAALDNVKTPSKQTTAAKLSQDVNTRAFPSNHLTKPGSLGQVLPSR